MDTKEALLDSFKHLTSLLHLFNCDRDQEYGEKPPDTTKHQNFATLNALTYILSAEEDDISLYIDAYTVSSRDLALPSLSIIGVATQDPEVIRMATPAHTTDPYIYQGASYWAGTRQNPLSRLSLRCVLTH